MNDKKKTVLFIMPRLPFPAISGRKSSLFHYCRILSEELGYRLVVAAFLEDGDDPKEKPDFINKLIVLPKGNIVSRIFTIMKDSFILHKKPMQVSLYYNKNAERIVEKVAEEEKPDFVIGDMVRSTEYIRSLNCYRIADLDDRLSLRYERQLETSIEQTNPYGAILNSLPVFIQKLLLIDKVKIAVMKHEIRLLKKYELEVGRICEKTIFVAENEAKSFNFELGMDKACAIPIGVDINYFKYKETSDNNFYIGFLGALNVAHNENAVRNFIINIFPLILRKKQEAKFLVIGGGASTELLQYSNTNIEFTGQVSDVRKYLQKCKVFVCPMTFGSGIKTKNLEAMSVGIPVVTTKVGAENIGAKPDVEWIIKDTNEEFANAVVELLTNADKQKKIGKSGSEFVNRNFTWNIARDRFAMLLAS